MMFVGGDSVADDAFIRATIGDRVASYSTCELS